MIFGIGLGKTGLTSLTAAMSMLGYRTLQRPVYIRANALRGVDFACDKPLPLRYADVDKLFPGSRFVYTERPIEDWLACQERLRKGRTRPDETMPEYDNEAYGGWQFNERRFREAYYRHREGVERYFEGRSRDLLRLNIFDGQGWPELTKFLGTPFPWKNRSG